MLRIARGLVVVAIVGAGVGCGGSKSTGPNGLPATDGFQEVFDSLSALSGSLFDGKLRATCAFWSRGLETVIGDSVPPGKTYEVLGPGATTWSQTSRPGAPAGATRAILYTQEPDGCRVAAARSEVGYFDLSHVTAFGSNLGVEAVGMIGGTPIGRVEWLYSLDWPRRRLIRGTFVVPGRVVRYTEDVLEERDRGDSIVVSFDGSPMKLRLSWEFRDNLQAEYLFDLQVEHPAGNIRYFGVVNYDTTDQSAGPYHLTAYFNEVAFAVVRGDLHSQEIVAPTGGTTPTLTQQRAACAIDWALQTLYQLGTSGLGLSIARANGTEGISNGYGDYPYWYPGQLCADLGLRYEDLLYGWYLP